jgi:Rps23 Pro-64 3,4-dihydroxylase Tpa1-like proline 4-hydroxylase
MDLKLNPSLDAAGLAELYRENGRIQIKDFLSPSSALAVLEELQSLPWGLVFNDGDRVVQLHADQVAQLSNREAAAIMAGIRERARSGYQFFYAFYPVLTAYFSPAIERRPIFEFYELMNSRAVLDFIRQVTGLPGINWADGQATWYKPGHFLKAHSDEAAAEVRMAAYVMNFSVDWDRDWGGFLQFFDRNGNVELGFKPDFNALNLFTIPAPHSVSMVSTYVTAKRLAVTGWFRGDQPPGPIGIAARG